MQINHTQSVKKTISCGRACDVYQERIDLRGQKGKKTHQTSNAETYSDEDLKDIFICMDEEVSMNVEPS